MGLRLVAGPANAGKVALLLERYLDAADRDPVLIVPNRSDVERVERDLLARCGALLGGWIGTFDDLFEELARSDSARRRVATDAERVLLARRAIAAVSLNGFGRSARTRGFADALLATLAELESGLVDPDALEGDLARLYEAYRRELDALEFWDRDLLRRRQAERLATDFRAWGGAPVFAYGFEDLTGAEWELLEALAARAEVQVSLPYEPGRAVFESLRRTAEDLAALAADGVEELPPRSAEYAHPALAQLERGLFHDTPPPPAATDGAVRFLEGAGTRGTLELVAEEVASLLRGGTPAEAIALVVPSLESRRGAVETVFGSIGIPFAFSGRLRLGQTAFGHALLSLLRFVWLDGGRLDLFAFLRTPYSGLSRSNVDFVEGRLRGRAVQPGRIEGEMEQLRGARVPALDLVRGAVSGLDAVRELATLMVRAAYGLDAPPLEGGAREDLRAHEAVQRLVVELDGWLGVGGTLSPDEVVGALERTEVRATRAGESGYVNVLDLLRARTRRFDAVFVLGLEEGTLPRRGLESPFLDEDARRALDARLRSRLQRPDGVSRERYLFYTACTRATHRLYLVREAATDDGAPLEPSPFWDEARELFDAEDAQRATRRRPLSALTWELPAAPTDRERVRAVAVLAATDAVAAEALARANGWSRKLERARGAFERPTALRDPGVLNQLAARGVFNVTELERFADCSSAWFIDRLIDPKTIDAEVDAKLRGSVAHSALYKFFTTLPRELGADRVFAEQVEAAVALMHRCLDQALEGVRVEMTDLQERELRQGLRRDLEQLVRAEAESELPLVPRRFEVLFGSERSAPELQRGLDLGGATLSGKIDRIDVDPFSARGIVQDYKSGKTAHSAVEIERELRLQIPLYMLVLRDLVGIEPLGGVYRPLAGARRARGLLRAEAKDDGIGGFVGRDYLDEDAFWRQVEGARETARALAERIRRGDVQHDPKGNECPAWCDLWPMCRVRRA